MSMDGQGTKCRRKSAENYSRLSRVHERYRRTADRRQTDGQATAYGERECEFTFAKNRQKQPTSYAGSPKTVLDPNLSLFNRQNC